MQVTENPDLELIKRVAAKDSKALEALYDSYSPLLFTLIKKIAGNDADAEQILSDIFVIIWKKSDHFNSNNVYSWLITLTRNKTVDFIRRNKGLITEDYNDEYENIHILPALSSRIDDMDLALAFEKYEKTNSAFRKLTEAQQYVLSLAYFEGLTQTEIATKLNIPLPTVKSKIRVALSSLNENIKLGN